MIRIFIRKFSKIQADFMRFERLDWCTPGPTLFRSNLQFYFRSALSLLNLTVFATARDIYNLLILSNQLQIHMHPVYCVCSTVGVLSTVGVFSTMGGYHEYRGGYHEYRGEYLEYRGVFSTVGDIMINVGIS